MWLKQLLTLASFWLLCACSDATEPVAPTLFRVAVGTESFSVLIVDRETITRAVRQVEEGTNGIVIGTLEYGDGGFNAPWSWHLVPESVRIGDATSEVCDGLPSMVEADLTYWVETVQQFCPWRGRLTDWQVYPGG